MKLSEYQEKLKADREYQAAYQQLEYQFLFGNAVLRTRLNKGWSQKELAKRVGTKQANISRIEAGLGNPTLDLIQKICKALDMNLEFIGRSSEKGEAEFVTSTEVTVFDYPGSEPIPAPSLFIKVKDNSSTYTSTTASRIKETQSK